MHRGSTPAGQPSQLSPATWYGGADCLHDIPRARIAIIRRVKPQTVLPVSFRPYVEIDVRLLPPEQVRRDRNESLLCQLIAGRSDVGVNAKQFLENDHCRRG